MSFLSPKQRRKEGRERDRRGKGKGKGEETGEAKENQEEDGGFLLHI